ncbi:IclR family transcriptional regulator [Gymnodinialimonas hymeniacidonis]|uniref:IclR family transcriptional regulator n=1 Tax=Gymnodinialimonas hymeniacidonis TaxID=3126508 RepID=UPI0034C6A5B7
MEDVRGPEVGGKPVASEASDSSDGTVGKALTVLDTVASYGRPVRFGELLADSPFPKATLYRLMQVLTKQSMLTYDPDRQTYAPGLRLVRLAHSAWQSASLAPVARPYLEALSAEVGETVHLAQLDGGQVLYVDKINARDPLQMYSQAGKVGPVYCTGVGKAMAAFLPAADQEKLLLQQSYHPFTAHTLSTPDDLRAELHAIVERGHAYDREEHEPGIICVAVPIITRAGRVLGAVSVTSSTERTSLDGLDAHLPRINDAVSSIAGEAQDWRFPDAAE